VGAPRDGKEAAKEVFLDTILNAKTIALEMIDDFRASDRFFKYKAGVVAGWVLLSVATLFIACPPAREGSSNELDASVRVQQVSALDRQITTLVIENQSSDDWEVVLLKLNNVYSAALPSIAAGKSVPVQLSKFSDTGGKTPPDNLRPQKLELRCSEGEATFDLSAPKP
jgi:hypothetical protein